MKEGEGRSRAVGAEWGSELLPRRAHHPSFVSAVTFTPSPVTSNTQRVERRAQRLRHPLAEVDEALGVVWEPRCPTLRNEVDHLERGTALERTCAGVHLYGDRERGPRGARADCLSGSDWTRCRIA